jgi:hypothetical protein
MSTDWRALCLDLADALRKLPLNDERSRLLHRVLEADGRGGSFTPLAALEMPPDLYNPLRRAGYDTVELVAAAGPEVLMRVNLLGPDRVGRILAAISAWQRRRTTE